MYQAKKLQFDWTFVLMVGDLLAVALSMPLAFEGIQLTDSIRENATPRLATCVVYGLLILYVLHSLSLYTWSSFMGPHRTVARIIAATVLSALAFVVARYFFGDENSRYYESWLVLHSLILIALILGFRLLTRFLLVDVFQSIPTERIAFIGWDARLERVLNTMQNEKSGFQKVIGFFYPGGDLAFEPAHAKNYEALGTFAELTRKLEEQRITLLMVEESSVGPAQIQKLAEVCGRSLVSLKVIPSAFDVWASKLNLSVVAGVPLLGIHDIRMDRLGFRIAKRAIDIAGGLFGLICSIPIILILMWLIKRESPGTIFFRQVRLGLHGKPFKIIKLRSMKLDAEVQTGAVWAVADDPRRLKIGAFMRKWNLDELPQFWNVLKGEMSLVGPRPERPEFVEGFKETIRYYNMRHSCKPGVTGWAAVNGLRGNTSLEDRLEYDLFYIENWSLQLDFRIMLMTLMPPKNAY